MPNKEEILLGFSDIEMRLMHKEISEMVSLYIEAKGEIAFSKCLKMVFDNIKGKNKKEDEIFASGIIATLILNSVKEQHEKHELIHKILNDAENLGGES